MLRHEASATDETDSSFLRMTGVYKKIGVKAGLSQPNNADFAFQIKIHFFTFDARKLAKQDFNI